MPFQKFKLKIAARIFLILCPILMSYVSIAKASASAVINKSLSISANKERVWSVLTDEAELARWWNKGVKLEPFVDGEFYEPWGNDQLATGKVLFVEPVENIRFTWKEKTWSDDQQTVCEFSISEEEGVTTLLVKHSGWEVFQNSKDQMMDGFSQGWDFLLPKLKNYIESEQ